jgi:hypothetical protein
MIKAKEAEKLIVELNPAEVAEVICRLKLKGNVYLRDARLLEAWNAKGKDNGKAN